MKFEKEYTVGVRDIGISNQMTNYAFLSYLEEIASNHSDNVGFGVKDIDIKKKAWILMDWKLKVFKRPKYQDKILIKTWARPIGRRSISTYRDFEVYLNGEKVAIATSKWVLFDLELNKIIKIDEEIIKDYFPEDEYVFENSELEKIVDSDFENCTLEYKVRRSDIDINNHMHNLNYILLAYEALPEKEYNLGEKNNVRITYKNQILLGNSVYGYYSKQDEKNVVVLKSEDGLVTHSIIELS